jgi:2-dehydro-3-deoxy-D-gluconate 5-dehydrogenase
MTRAFREIVPEAAKEIATRTPQGRWATPKDLACVAAFLAGPASDFITGAAFVADGGFTIAAA